MNAISLRSALEQDKAAGGADLRKIRTKTGDIATISLALAESGDGTRITLRFKWGGSNVQRPVGKVVAASRSDALKLGWKMIRDQQIVERQGWSWVVPSA